MRKSGGPFCIFDSTFLYKCGRMVKDVIKYHEAVRGYVFNEKEQRI